MLVQARVWKLQVMRMTQTFDPAKLAGVALLATLKAPLLLQARQIAPHRDPKRLRFDANTHRKKSRGRRGQHLRQNFNPTSIRLSLTSPIRSKIGGRRKHDTLVCRAIKHPPAMAHENRAKGQKSPRTQPPVNRRRLPFSVTRPHSRAPLRRPTPPGRAKR